MQLNYDATNVTPRSFSPIPTSWQNMQLDSWEEKPTRKDNGDTLAECVFEVIDGEHKGRKLFMNLNVGLESSPKAKEIAFETLAAWMHAAGVLKINTLDDLLRKPVCGRVKHVAAVLEEDGSEKYGEKNEIKGFKKIEGAAPAVGGASGLPAGFTSQATAAPAAAAAAIVSQPVSIPGVVAAPAAPAPAPVPKIKVLVMTAKANGMTAEQFRAHDAAWTDALLVQEGYAVIEERDDPAAKAAAPAAPATPAVPTTPSTPAPAAAATESSSAASAGADDSDLPPWERG